jgi:hypothetical protein
MSTEQIRADFEIAFAKKCGVSIESVKARRSGDGYWDEAHWRTKGISDAWYFWQKSRAALVLKLPETTDVVDWCCSADVFEATKVSECLRAAGITVKEG